MAKQAKTNKRAIRNYTHQGKQRPNNPPVGLVTPETDRDAGKKTYAYDPHIDPQLAWAGKAERTAFDVPTVSLHVHERMDPRTIIEATRKRNGSDLQPSLFTAPEENPPLRQAIDFYRHKHNWTNRLIAGDSLLVMNSLLEKEGMAGKVQCVYMDPPYGIRYGSNFQPFVNKRDVRDGKDEDLTAEPEMIRAFRDTWELGVHSYLTYLRDRLALARKLLTESGSCFVQIGDENVHRVGTVMDDVFGAHHRVATISFATTSGSSTSHLPQVADYLLWYAKDKENVKYRQLYEPLTRAEIVDYFSWHVMVELPDGRCRKLTDEERFDPDKYLPKGARIYRRTGLDSQGVSTTGRSDPYEWNGKVFHCAKKRHWSISQEGLDRLGELGRLEALEGQTSLMWKKYEEEVPGRRLNNIWPAQMYPSDKIYVVETATKAIQRCLLMTTDPGDLVFDPTCGSGATAHVAEQWGRRWMTCDTSRVALTLARQRLMTAVYEYYELAHAQEGVGSGFRYKTVPNVSPHVLANEEPPSVITLYDQPVIDRGTARVTGPFTVEAVPSPTVKSIDEIVDPHPHPLPKGEGAHSPLPPGEGGRRPGEGKPPINPKLLTRARKLRTEQTDAEQLLWYLLRNRQFCGLKFRRQHPVEPYVLDFYCDKNQAGIELDGGQHNEPAKKRRDEERTTFFESKGIRVIRFWNHEVLQETEAVVERLYHFLFLPFTPTLSQSERENLPNSPLPPGEGGRRPGEGNERIADQSVARSGETLRQEEWRDELLKTGIRGKAGQRIAFARLEPLPGTRWLHAEGETRPDAAGAEHVRDPAPAWTPERVVVSFGPDHAPLEQRQVALALEEAHTLVPKPRIVVFAAFQFDPEASKDVDETNWPGVTLLKAQMNADLLTEDLKKTRTGHESFWLIGQPDVQLETIVEGDHAGKFRVAVHGFDYFNTKTGSVESGGSDKIATWMLDPDYDGRSLFPRQLFFPMAGPKDGWTKLARNLKAEIDPDMIEAYRGTVSLPFDPGKHGRVAVKIVDDRGVESLRVLEVQE